MLTFDSLPQARVVRQGGQHFAPPRAPRPRPEPSAVREQLRTMLAMAIGLWPLTSVMLLMFGLLYMVGMMNAP